MIIKKILEKERNNTLKIALRAAENSRGKTNKARQMK